MNNDAKSTLKGLSLLCTIVGLGLDLLSTIISEKKETIEIQEAVQKEVTRQLTMKE